MYGGDGDDYLYGDAGNDWLDGSLLGDYMAGGAGNDKYFVDSVSDVVDESYLTQDTGGTDTVWSSIDYTLGNFVENLNLQGAAEQGTGNGLANIIIGNAESNTLVGGAGNDTLYGGEGYDHLDGEEGNDIMIGGAKNDVYDVNSVGDKVYETTTIGGSVDAGGYDQVDSTVDYTLGKFVEVLILRDHAIKGTGNSLNNNLYGNDEDNILDGKAGYDWMVGGDGNDTYYVDLDDGIWENAGEGIDTVISMAPSHMLNDNVEILILAGYAGIHGTGNDLDNQIFGNPGANILSGGGGNDTLNGGAGNDNMYGGDGGDDLDGGTGDDYLSGGGGHDILNGGAGNDIMFGGAGDDIYYVGSTGDKVYETTTAISVVDMGGIDMVYSSVSYTLGQFVEILYLTGSAAISGTGNDLDNSIYGNSAANTLRGGAGHDFLDGGAGNDIMFGGAGNDIYIVRSTGDKVYETTTPTSGVDSGGTDTIYSFVSYTLGVFVENLTLSGSAHINGTGNGLINILYGNSGNNILDGGAGNDTMAGRHGNDTYIVNGLDTIIENLDDGYGYCPDQSFAHLGSKRGEPDPDRHRRYQWHRQRA